MAVRQSGSTTPPVTVQKVVTDPIWSLKIWPVTFTVAGQDFTIPALSASDWLEVLMVPEIDLLAIVNDLLPDEDNAELIDLMWEVEDEFTMDDLHDLMFEVVSGVTGRPWWIALRLIAATQVNWDFIGADLALQGVRADTISIAAWLDVVLLTMLRNIDPEKATMFTSQLEMVPPGMTVEPVDMEISREQFMSMS